VRIVTGVDGSATSLEALRYSADLARSQSAELIAVYATPGKGAAASALEELQKKADEVASAAGVEVKVRAEPGDPADVLIKVVEDEEADLLVVGNKGMTGASRFLLGSVPNKVSHTSPCDLLIVRTT
jgi:nucleotide-binding universal stress UspA family protein